MPTEAPVAMARCGRAFRGPFRCSYCGCAWLPITRGAIRSIGGAAAIFRVTPQQQAQSECDERSVRDNQGNRIEHQAWNPRAAPPRFRPVP